MDLKKDIDQIFSTIFESILKKEQDNLKNSGLSELSLNEIHLIVKIKELQKNTIVTPQVLLNELKITKGSLSIATSRLIKKNYLEKETNTNDARKIYFKLKPKAKYAIELHENWHKKLVEVALEDVSEDEQQKILLILNNIDKNIDKLK